MGEGVFQAGELPRRPLPCSQLLFPWPELHEDLLAVSVILGAMGLDSSDL